MLSKLVSSRRRRSPRLIAEVIGGVRHRMESAEVSPILARVSSRLYLSSVTTRDLLYSIVYYVVVTLCAAAFITGDQRSPSIGLLRRTQFNYTVSQKKLTAYIIMCDNYFRACPRICSYSVHLSS